MERRHTPEGERYGQEYPSIYVAENISDFTSFREQQLKDPDVRFAVQHGRGNSRLNTVACVTIIPNVEHQVAHDPDPKRGIKGRIENGFGGTPITLQDSTGNVTVRPYTQQDLWFPYLTALSEYQTGRFSHGKWHEWKWKNWSGMAVVYSKFTVGLFSTVKNAVTNRGEYGDIVDNRYLIDIITPDQREIRQVLEGKRYFNPDTLITNP